jgi:hypothetical protein
MKTEARYRTAGGKTLEVTSSAETFGYEIYRWSCPGCRTEIPLTASQRHDTAIKTADEHARSCRAI